MTMKRGMIRGRRQGLQNPVRRVRLPLLLLLLTGCAGFQDAAEEVAAKTAEATLAPYKADMLTCATLADSERQALECMAEVRRAWVPILGPGSVEGVVLQPIPVEPESPPPDAEPLPLNSNEVAQ